MRPVSKFLLLLIIISLLTACASQQGEQIDYKETKSMVVDILKTEDGQKAIEEVTKKQKEKQGKMMQMLTSPQGEQIQIAVKNVLTDPNYPKHLQTLMKDPKFAGEFAKAVQKENKEIHKALMKDPEYQTMLIDVMKNPEFEKILMDTMKSKQYRQQAMTVMEEALNNPLFRLELMELMKKVLEEEAHTKDSESKDKGDEGKDSGESDGGGGDS